MAYHTMPFTVWPEHTVDRSSVLTESWRRRSEARPLGQGEEFPRLASIQLSMNTEEFYPLTYRDSDFFWIWAKNFCNFLKVNSSALAIRCYLRVKNPPKMRKNGAQIPVFRIIVYGVGIYAHAPSNRQKRVKFRLFLAFFIHLLTAEGTLLPSAALRAWSRMRTHLAP